MKRFLHTLLACVGWTGICSNACAHDLSPEAYFLQFGTARRDSSATNIGLLWHWDWRKPVLGGTVHGYSEASIGLWQSRYGANYQSSHLVHIGITPVVRWTRSNLFVEAGIGVNLHSRTYRREERRFSTAFNFGDHIGIGWSWGEQGEHELALRFQHFSNAGIKKPNPGEELFQVRYAYRPAH